MPLWGILYDNSRILFIPKSGEIVVFFHKNSVKGLGNLNPDAYLEALKGCPNLFFKG